MNFLVRICVLVLFSSVNCVAYGLDGSFILTGQVVNEQGEGVGGVKLYLATEANPVRIEQGLKIVDSGNGQGLTKANGRFVMQGVGDRWGLIAIKEGGGIGGHEGCATIGKEDFLANGKKIVLKAWSELGVKFKLRDEIGADKKIGMSWTLRSKVGEMWVTGDFEGKTDEHGHLSLGKCFAGQYSVGHLSSEKGYGKQIGHGPSIIVRVDDGEKKVVALGGGGVIVRGRLQLNDGWRKGWGRSAFLRVSRKLPKELDVTKHFPLDLQESIGEERYLKLEVWKNTKEGAEYIGKLDHYAETQSDYISVALGDEGEFLIEDLQPGTYRFLASVYQPKQGGSCGVGELIGVYDEDFVVNDGSNDEIDMGVVELNPIVSVKVGEDAPYFERKDLDGRVVNITDFKGKNVGLVFWGRTCSPPNEQMKKLNKVWDRFGVREDFVMVGMNHEPESLALKGYLEEHGIEWFQLRDPFDPNVGPGSDLFMEYGVTASPAFYLIGPDGKVVHKNISAGDVMYVVDRYFKKVDAGQEKDVEEEATQ
ncbi:TlpA family protein disulfide reductase [Planctomycetota bacterium]|nr:TlpA family protein disulfide reductase [Planctomycetota bacterium]